MTLKGRARRRWRTALRALRLECPLVLPCRVELDPRPPPRPKNLWRYSAAHFAGWSMMTGDETGFRIVVRTHVYELGAPRPRALFPGELVETLVHEWAHCRAWFADHSQLQDHGPGWALAYGECYRTVIED